MNELDAISGGTYREYVDISNAIAKRISHINRNDPNFKRRTERLTQEETDNWLRTNLDIAANFGISVSSKPLDFINSDAKYHSIESTTAGKKFSHSYVLKQIAEWQP